MLSPFSIAHLCGRRLHRRQSAPACHPTCRSIIIVVTQCGRQTQHGDRGGSGASWQRQPASAEAAPACLAELQPTGARTRAEGHQSVVDSGRNAAEGAQPADEQKVLAIDKSGLKSVPEHEHGEQPHKGSETPLLRHLKALIRVRFHVLLTGPRPSRLLLHCH